MCPGIRVAADDSAAQIRSALPSEVIVYGMLMPQSGSANALHRQPDAPARVIMFGPLEQDAPIDQGASYYMLQPVDGAVRPAEPVQPDTTRRVTSLLQQLGIPAHMSGYRYLSRAVQLALGAPGLIHSATHELYPQVALEECSTASRVERAIRHAIQVAWDRGISSAVRRRLPLHPDLRPTNTELIALLAEHLRYTPDAYLN